MSILLDFILGIEQSTYVSEGDINANVIVKIVKGIADEDITVQFSSEDNSALSM